VSRVNVYATYENLADEHGYEAPVLVGHFESSKAEQWSDASIDGNGSGGTGRGTALLRTAGGKWVLAHWTRWQGESDTYAYIEADSAKDWLLRHHEDEAVTKYFGEIPEEEDRRPGRPAIGDGNAINVRLGELLGRVDAFATKGGTSRAAAIRELVLAGLEELEGF
jgi:hypothetical protein